MAPGASRNCYDIAMDFDRYTIALLLLRPDAPVLSAAEEDALQDAHMAHLAELHEAGHLLVAGPVLGDPDRAFRGLSILNVEPQRARELKERDPAVIAGRFRVEVYPWIFPRGLVAFSKGRLPRSMAETRDN
jgi:uncharacterized protein YciI